MKTAVNVRYEVCPKCGAGSDEDEQANQCCDACGYDAILRTDR